MKLAILLVWTFSASVNCVAREEMHGVLICNDQHPKMNKNEKCITTLQCAESEDFSVVCLNSECRCFENDFTYKETNYTDTPGDTGVRGSPQPNRAGSLIPQLFTFILLFIVVNF